MSDRPRCRSCAYVWPFTFRAPYKFVCGPCFHARYNVRPAVEPQQEREPRRMKFPRPRKSVEGDEPHGSWHDAVRKIEDAPGEEEQP